jgi:hypothetical protein
MWADAFVPGPVMICGITEVTESHVEIAVVQLRQRGDGTTMKSYCFSSFHALIILNSAGSKSGFFGSRLEGPTRVASPNVSWISSLTPVNLQ